MREQSKRARKIPQLKLTSGRQRRLKMAREFVRCMYVIGEVKAKVRTLSINCNRTSQNEIYPPYKID